MSETKITWSQLVQKVGESFPGDPPSEYTIRQALSSRGIRGERTLSNRRSVMYNEVAVQEVVTWIKENILKSN